MIKFKCIKCTQGLSHIVKLSDEMYWYECPACKCQASIWAPGWEKRYDLKGIEIEIEGGETWQG